MRIFLYSLIFLLTLTPAFAQPEPGQLLVHKNYYACAAQINKGDPKDFSRRSEEGYIGPFEFGIVSAQEGGLCAAPVPFNRREQAWALCDFKGPIALKYDIHNDYDLRFNVPAETAQMEMMRKLTTVYDDYIYEKKYDLFFGKSIRAIQVTPDILRGLLHAKGRAAVDEFLHGRDIRDSENSGFYIMASCFRKCLSSKDAKWDCGVRR